MSDYLGCQVAFANFARASWAFALRRASSLRAIAIRTTILGLPAARSLSRKFPRVSSKRAAMPATRKRIDSTPALPPRMWRFPDLGPPSFAIGATPTSLAISLLLVPAYALAASAPAEVWRIASGAFDPDTPIGVATMEQDGTIVLDLRRTADGIDISMPPRRYTPSDPRYRETLRHIGPLKPGETVLLKPWPETGER